MLLIVASFASGAEKAPPALQPDSFRFIRTEAKVFPPVRRDGRIIAEGTKAIFGVFAFRYSHPTPLKFYGFGASEDRNFITRFTEYQILRTSAWEALSVGYCGTGATTYVLQPGVDYELRISLPPRGLSAPVQLRVSADSPNATFWSEPFLYPA